MTRPKVSIITPSFNQARFLPATLESVRAQDYPNLEHLVVDGGSTDGSVEILRRAPGIQWSSEPDRGQVDALNQGFARATGDILAWLNSDDILHPHTVSVAVAALEQTGADLVYGDVEIVNEHGCFLKWSHGIPFDYAILLYGINYIGQQTVFFRRLLFERGGPLREEFTNAFDYELWLRYAQHGQLAYCPELRAQIRVHAAAKSVAQNNRTWADTARIRSEYWPHGGQPRWLSTRPWCHALNYYYRAKRQWRLRTCAAKSPQ